jgi:hypothetical protein
VELQDVLTASGVKRTMEQVVDSLREIGGEDLSVDFAEFIEYLVTSAPPKQQQSKTIGFGSLSAFGRKNKKNNIGKQGSDLGAGVAVDSTGDGVSDAVGYDTTGDGKIDSYDTTGDGRIDSLDTTGER